MGFKMNFLEDLNELIEDFHYLKNKIVHKYKKYSFLDMKHEEIMNFMLSKVNNIISNVERKGNIKELNNI